MALVNKTLDSSLIYVNQNSALSLNAKSFFLMRTILLFGNICSFVLYFALSHLGDKKNPIYHPNIFSLSSCLIPLFLTITILVFLTKSKKEVKHKKFLLVTAIINIIVIFIYIVHHFIPGTLNFLTYKVREKHPLYPWIYLDDWCLKFYHCCIQYLIFSFSSYIIFPLLLVILPQKINDGFFFSKWLALTFCIIQSTMAFFCVLSKTIGDIMNTD